MTTQTLDLTKLLGNIAGPLADIFGDIGTAEEEIEAACKAAPLHLRPLLFGSFLLMQPQMRMPALLYVAHCRELLRRVACGGDLDAPTVGEIGTAIYEMTLVAPMREVIGGLYMQIVQEAAPREYRRAGLHDSSYRFHESYPGQLAEARAEIVRHLAKRLTPRTPPRPRSPSGQRRESMAEDGIIFPKEGDMHTLYTIGYSGLKAETLHRWATAHGALVVDTRMNAYSPRPEWQKGALKKLMDDRYQHVQALGNVNYKTGGEIALKDPAEGFRIVLESLVTQPVVLLCGCKDVETCHRKFIADAVEASTGAPAVHLAPEDLAAPAAVEVAAVVPEEPDGDLTQRGLFSPRDDKLVNPAVNQFKLL